MNTIVELSPDVLFQELDDEAVMLNMATEQYHGLDEVGKRIWKLLAQDGSVQAVIDQMRVEYDVDEAVLRRDVMALINALAEQGLVQVKIV